MSNVSATTKQSKSKVIYPHDYTTFIGLDVHARTIAACALQRTGVIESRSFKHYEVDDLIVWAKGFDEPHLVYESGVTGFALYRKLKAAGLSCAIVAVSNMPKSTKDKVLKTDKRDAQMLARLSSYNMLTEIYVPSEVYEQARDLSRVLDQTREDLQRARQRLSKFLIRLAEIYHELSPKGNLKKAWTRDYWKWLDTVELQGYHRDCLDHYISEVRHLEKEKKRLEKLIVKITQQDPFKERVEALCLIKGISTITAFALVSECALFSRFDSARSFMSYLGLVPSEHSSGQHVQRGSITKCGNRYLRKLLVESAWHYMRATAIPKKPKENSSVPLAAQRVARESTKRLSERFRYLIGKQKKSVVVNCACARELAGFVWAIGRICEGTLS